MNIFLKLFQPIQKSARPSIRKTFPVHSCDVYTSLGISSPLQDQSYSGLDYGMYDYPEQRDEDYQVTEPGDPEEYEEMVPTTVHSQVMTRPTRAYKRYESGHVYQEYNCEAYCSASCHTLSLLAVAAGGVAVLYRLLATL